MYDKMESSKGRYCCNLKCFKLKSNEVDGISCEICYAHNQCRCECITYINSNSINVNENVLILLKNSIKNLYTISLYINNIKEIKKVKNMIDVINNIKYDIYYHNI